RTFDGRRAADHDVATALAADRDRRRAGRRTLTTAARSGRQTRRPRERQLFDVRLVDLRQRAVAPPGVVAGVRRPLIAERFQQPRWIESIRGAQRYRGRTNDRDRDTKVSRYNRTSYVARLFRAAIIPAPSAQPPAPSHSHFNVTRYAVTLWMSASVYTRSSS